MALQCLFRSSFRSQVRVLCSLTPRNKTRQRILTPRPGEALLARVTIGVEPSHFAGRQ